LARWGSRFAPLANAIASSAIGRRLNEEFFGIDRRRTPPVWSRQTLTDRLSRVTSRVPKPGAVLFADTFTQHADPEIGVAAFELLEHAGIGARLAPHSCCGRPLISQGLLHEARALAMHNTLALHPVAERGEAIVFLEPSCLSAIREDVPALLSGEVARKAREVSAHAVLFEEFLERELSASRATLALGRGPSTILLHPHCHQRSMGLAAPAAALLARIPGATVTDLDAGCCGMAGSFGYAVEHYDVSRAIGERKLLPAARTMGADGVLVAAGTSCRHQVAHFTDARAVHPAVLLRSLVTDKA
jgi:Fe-S oxidoreductase